MILRKDKTDPITKLEFDNNMTELMDRIDLSSNQEITGVKTFKSFPVHAVADDDYSTKVANADHMESKVPMFSNVAKSGSTITSLKTFNSPVTATGGNVATKGYYDTMNKKSVHFSTELPINPDNNPIAENWFYMDVDGNLIDVFKYVNGAWERTFINLKISQILGTDDTTIVLKTTSGDYYGVGPNEYGKYGLGHNDDLNFTKLPDIFKESKEILLGSNVIIIIKTDNTVWGAGRNLLGELGLGDNTNRNVFTQIHDAFNPKKIYIFDSIMYVVKQDGTLWGCGANYWGGIGIGEISSVGSDPVWKSQWTLSICPNILNPIDIIRSAVGSLVINGDKTVWVCGWNGDNRLGINAASDLYYFTQIPDISNVKSISSIYGDNKGIVTEDGRFFMCGWNHMGQFGNPSVSTITYNNYLETDITNVKEAYVYYSNTLVVKNDGTLWVSGYNESGELGLGNYTYIIDTWTQVNLPGSILNLYIINDSVTWIKVDVNGEIKFYYTGTAYNNNFFLLDNEETYANGYSVSSVNTFTESLKPIKELYNGNIISFFVNDLDELEYSVNVQYYLDYYYD